MLPEWPHHRITTAAEHDLAVYHERLVERAHREILEVVDPAPSAPCRPYVAVPPLGRSGGRMDQIAIREAGMEVIQDDPPIAEYSLQDWFELLDDR